MGNPTYSGLEMVQAEFQETAFPLPGFRKEICGGQQFVYSCGLPMHNFVAGVPADLHFLATNEPYGQPQNVALCAEDGGYGLRFVEEYFLQDACTLYPERDQTLVRVAVQIEPYGSAAFLAFLSERCDAIGSMARYGKTNRSLKDWAMLRFFPERYVFPTHVARAA